MICPRCQAETQAAATHCANCGYDLAQPDIDYAEIVLQDYIPGELIAQLEQARQLARDPANVAVAVDNLAQQSQLAFFNGDYNETIAFSNEAYRLSLSANNKWGVASSRFLAVYMCYLDRGEVGKALNVLHEGVAAAREARHVTADILMSADLGWVYTQLGAFDRAAPFIHYAHDSALEKSARLIPWTKTRLARLYLASGHMDEANVSIRLAREYMEGVTLVLSTLFVVPLTEARIALMNRDYAGARRIVDPLIDKLYHFQMRPYTADSLFLRARILIGEGKIDEARKVIIKARASAEALSMKRLLWPILYDLSQIDDTRGEHESGTTWREQAQRVCLQFADSIGDAELRQSFVSQPHVARVLNG